MVNFTLNMNSNNCKKFKIIGQKIQQRHSDDLLPFDDVMNALYEILRRQHISVPLEVVDGTNDSVEIAKCSLLVPLVDCI